MKTLATRFVAATLLVLAVLVGISYAYTQAEASARAYAADSKKGYATTDKTTANQIKGAATLYGQKYQQWIGHMDSTHECTWSYGSYSSTELSEGESHMTEGDEEIQSGDSAMSTGNMYFNFLHNYDMAYSYYDAAYSYYAAAQTNYNDAAVHFAAYRTIANSAENSGDTHHDNDHMGCDYSVWD